MANGRQPTGTQSAVNGLMQSQLDEEKAERAEGDECGPDPLRDFEHP
jgi:hypothetical protein